MPAAGGGRAMDESAGSRKRWIVIAGIYWRSEVKGAAGAQRMDMTVRKRPERNGGMEIPRIHNCVN